MKLLLLLVITPLMASQQADADRHAIIEIERERDVTKHILTERLHVIDRQLEYIKVRLKVSDCPHMIMEEAEKVHGDKHALLTLMNRMRK
jgi:hypothetical protein